MSVDRAELCAVAVYALPLLLWLVVRARRATPLIAIALDIPAILAADLFGVILLARLMPFEVAVLVSRPLWLVGIGGVAFFRHRRFGERPAWPRALDARVITATVIAGAVVTYVSSYLTHDYVYWDRYWHDPQVAAIATQHVPFVNALEPSAVLRYHYAADAYGAELRALSFYVLSSNRALALAHALAFALTASMTTLFAIGLARGRLVVLAVVLGVSAPLYGPIPLQNELAALLSGYMYSTNVINSGRPNVALAGFLVAGIACVAAGGLVAKRDTPPLETFARLVPLFALMSLTDEPALAACGAALFLAWLVDGRLLSESRALGLGMLVVLAVCAALPTRMLGGSLSPGGPIDKLEWVAAKVPPAQPGAAMPFTDPRAMHALQIDLLPMMLCCGAITIVLLLRPSRGLLALLALAATVIASCTYVAMHLKVNGREDSESQRFFLAPLVVSSCAAVAAVSRPRASALSVLVALGGIGVPAIFSLFLVIRAPLMLTKEKITGSPKLCTSTTSIVAILRARVTSTACRGPHTSRPKSITCTRRVAGSSPLAGLTRLGPPRSFLTSAPSSSASSTPRWSPATSTSSPFVRAWPSSTIACAAVYSHIRRRAGPREPIT